MLFNLPNLLTLSRILAIPLVIGAFWLDKPWSQWLAMAIFVAASVTDWFDGYFARRYQMISRLGRFLDPIADKLLVAGALVMLVHKGPIVGLHVIPALIILFREILVSGLREFLAELRVSMPVSGLAKWKTAIQMTAVGVLLINEAGPAWLPVTEIGLVLLWLAAALTVITGYDYLRAGLAHMEGPFEPPPLEPEAPAASRTATLRRTT
jgi:cardiolipin synthase